MNKDSIDFGKLMTGDYITGVKENTKVSPNVEVEDGEYVSFPDGSVAKAIGERHENGGVKLIAPDMTMVLSDTKDSTINKTLVNKLGKKYNLNLSTNDTYSSVLDKFLKKIGYTKLVKEEEDLFNQVKKNTEKALSDGSLRINNEYLAKKIYQLQEKKEPLRLQFVEMFDILFNRQEKSKPKNERAFVDEQNGNTDTINSDLRNEANGEYSVDKQEASDVNSEMQLENGELPEDELTESEQFRLGGTYSMFKNLAKSKGYSLRKAFNILDRGGVLKKFPEGGWVISRNKNEHDESNLGDDYRDRSQHASKQQYGNIQNAEDSLTQLYRNFPFIFSSGKYDKFIELENGKVKVKSGVTLNKINNEFIGSLQGDMDVQMRKSAEYILNDTSGKFNDDAKNYAKQYLSNETFFNEQGKVRSKDSKLGNFTSSRFSLGVNLVIPEDMNMLRENDIYTYKQLQKQPEILKKLSPESLERLSNFQPPEDADFSIMEFKPGEPVVDAKVDKDLNPYEKDVVEDDFVENEVVDDINYSPDKVRNKLFAMPDQSYLAPEGLQAESMLMYKPNYITPLAMGIEDKIRRNTENLGFVASQIQSLPPTVSAGILASAISEASSGENDYIYNTWWGNTQNRSNAEQYNSQQMDSANASNNAALLNYEQRALKGLDNTMQNIRNWYDANRAVNINNFREQQIMNTMANLFPKYSIDGSATNVVFDPVNKSVYNKPNPYYDQALSTIPSKSNT